MVKKISKRYKKLTEAAKDKKIETVEDAVKEDCADIVAQDPRWALQEVSAYSNQNAISVELRLKYQPTDKVELLALNFDRQLSEDL